MHILLTNDDGFHAPGIAALCHALTGLAGTTSLTVVAPRDPQSAMGHSVTLDRGLAVAEVEAIEPQTGLKLSGYSVDGRPADCVKIAFEVLRPEGFDLVISGMNAGANIGVHVNYSGTVAAAREAAFRNVPAVAVSLHLRQEMPQWALAAAYGRRALEQVLAAGLEPGTIANINVPAHDHGEPKGMMTVPLSTAAPGDAYHQLDDGSHHIGSGLSFAEDQPGTDVAMLFDRWVTISPLRYDPTCAASLNRWAQIGK